MRQRPPFPWITDAGIPLIVAGLGVMGIRWPFSAGPFLIALGAIIFLVRTAYWISQWEEPGSRGGSLMSPHDVIKYLDDESRWGKRMRDWVAVSDEGGQRIEVRKNGRLEAFREFQRKAREPQSVIRAYGRRNGQGVAEPIPHTFWLTNGFSMLDTLTGGSGTSPTVPNGRSAETYTDVMVERAGVMASWPRMAFWDRRRFRHKLREQEEELQRFFAANPEEPEFITVEEAGNFLYEAADDRQRSALRAQVPALFETVTENAAGWVKYAAYEGACQLYGRWGEGLPLEPVGRQESSTDAFEEVFGSSEVKASDLSVLKRDLPKLLAYWRDKDA